jgi:hypothetical protein
MFPGWNADSVRAFASAMSGATYPRTKKGLQQAATHIDCAIDHALEALEIAR